MWHAYAPSPIGDLLLVANEEGLLQVHFPPALPPATRRAVTGGWRR
jgi:hypothetical protein